MNLKRVLIDLLTAEQCKDLCLELQLEADRRSPAAMANALASAKRAKPERLIVPLTVAQLRETLAQFDRPTDGERDELVRRLLEAGGRVSPLPVPPLELEAQDQLPPSGWPPAAAPAARVVRTGVDNTEQYRHATQAVQRPDVGVQDQFQAKRPPRTYRYDSSLDPALSWDEQRERDLGEWLLGLMVRAAKDGEKTVFAEPQVWAGGGARITSLADAAQMLQQISKPFLNWAGKAERHQIKVPTAPLFVHERHSTKAILDGIRHRKARGKSLDLFGDAGMDIGENLEAYEHKGPWQNRMILGDSLSVMNSLLEFEALSGQVQMIYIDPPYGVKFGSNFQPFVRKRDVKHGGDEDMTREPEMVKAYRDTWELGLHSYLTYLRDRLMVARELLHESGSVFVQISDENLHHVREVMEEVFGADCFVAVIAFTKTSGLEAADRLASRFDLLLWCAKDIKKLKYRSLWAPKTAGIGGFTDVLLPDGLERKLTPEESSGNTEPPAGAKVFRLSDLTKPGPGARYEVEFQGKRYSPGARWWGTTPEGMSALIAAKRIRVTGTTMKFVRFLSDFPLAAIANLWADTGIGYGSDKLYVVQTSARVIERCVLMTTDPGDLVLDPTCGSGTTSHVAEQWGRRWITIDTSRVPLALARQRLLTATFPYFELKSPQAGPAGGFVYKRKQNRRGEEVGGLVPHITLKSIANSDPPAMEVLVDRPEEVSGVTRVAGPFVVEASIAPVQPIESTGDGEAAAGSDAATHIQRMTEVLRQSKTLHLPGNRELTLAGVRRTVDTEYLHAEAKEGDKRVAIVFGPADGAVSATLVYEAGREAHYMKYERLYFFGFAVEPGARAMIEDEKKLRIPAAYVAVTPDVAMSDLLKTTRASEIFSVTGLPDVAVRRAKQKGPEGQPLYEVELKGLDLFDPQSMDTESLGGENVPCWMLDTDHDGMSFYASQVFFPKTSAWDNLQRSMKATFDESVWSHLAGTVSEPFALGDRRRVAVKVIDERGNELMRVLEVSE
ncbi:MAG: site-specific DNA-methyltransferase [Betaproteobacteria bacterium]|jgi:adenine-specific DNA-methyltransferase|nr:site-specific DNA-methyltransferase [Betaproteobacteria bacterium]